MVVERYENVSMRCRDNEIDGISDDTSQGSFKNAVFTVARDGDCDGESDGSGVGACFFVGAAVGANVLPEGSVKFTNLSSYKGATDPNILVKMKLNPLIIFFWSFRFESIESASIDSKV